MIIGYEEKEKTLDEAINFNKDNLFEYLTHLLFIRNANWFGSTADNTYREFSRYIDSIPIDDSIKMEINDKTMQAMTEASQHSYEAGFREACRLNKVLNSF